MIITIDGPTASGKSTIARLLAGQLDCLYINSGLLFRAVAYLLHKNNRITNTLTTISQEDIAQLFSKSGIQYRYKKDIGPLIFIGPENITPYLKTPNIDRYASIIAIQPLVRQAILEYQRILADDYTIVAEGRDCGTVIFPHAQYKFFLTASLEVRAQRWQKDQSNKPLSLEESKKTIQERDGRDSQRQIAPLKPANDAFIIDTTHMTVQEVIIMITEMLIEE